MSYIYIYMVCRIYHIYHIHIHVYIHIHIHIPYTIHSIVFFYISMPLLESMLLSVFANPSRNWTFQRFAMVAAKERTQRNKLKI